MALNVSDGSRSRGGDIRRPQPIIDLSNDQLRERFRGAMLGLAAGDAHGTTLEFGAGLRRQGAIPLREIVGGGPFQLKAGQWTDDTTMAVCMAESIVRAGWNPTDQLYLYARWRVNGYNSPKGYCFDIGGTTSRAISEFMATRMPFRRPNEMASNGSLMRLAPAVLYAFRKYVMSPLSPWEAYAEFDRIVAESSMTTHANMCAVDSCRYAAAIMAGALVGEKKEELLSSFYHPLGTSWWDKYPLHPDVERIAAGSYKELSPPYIKGSGYADESLEAALWAFNRSWNFQDGSTDAVNLGDDADTTGAVYGQIAGAYYGRTGIPSHWLGILWEGKRIKELADRIFDTRS